MSSNRVTIGSPLPAGTNTIGDVGVVGVVSVDDNGGSLTVDGSVAVSNFPATQPVSGTVAISNPTTNPETGLAKDASLGGLTETAPATDTASSALNGRLQRIAQRLTSLIALLPASLGQKTKAASLAVTLASDQDALPITDNAGSLTVDGTVAATQSGTWNVTNVSGTVSLPTGAATAAKQPALGTAGTSSADVLTVQGRAAMTPLLVDGSAVTQPVSAAALPLPSGAATSAKQDSQTTLLGGGLPSVLATDRLKVDGSGVTQPVSGTVTANAGTNLNTSALALEASQAAGQVLTGAVTETAPATDTASSGLNGRLQRIAQRLTSLIAVFAIGAGTEAAAVRVTLPTDGTGKVNAAQSGTWTVQPGNTANTTAWKVDGSAVTQPVSNATLPLPTGASTAAKQPALGTAGTASADVISVQGVASMIPVQTANRLIVVTSTPTVDTAAYATGDNLFGTAIVDLGAVVRANGGTGTIVGLEVIDISNPSGVNNPATLEVWLFDTTFTLPAANAAANYADASVARCLEVIDVASWRSTTVNSFCKRDLWKPFKCASADTHLYMAVIVRGTPTYGASDLTFNLLVAQD